MIDQAQIRYTGIESHDGLTHYGLYDTVVAGEEVPKCKIEPPKKQHEPHLDPASATRRANVEHRAGGGADDDLPGVGSGDRAVPHPRRPPPPSRPQRSLRQMSNAHPVLKLLSVGINFEQAGRVGTITQKIRILWSKKPWLSAAQP